MQIDPSYRVSIANASNSPQTFSILTALPRPASAAATDKVFVNVLLSAPQIQSGADSVASFDITKRFFAICGSSITATAGVKIRKSSHVHVALQQDATPGTKLWLEVDSAGMPGFVEEKASTTSDPGAFAIATGPFSSAGASSTAFIGIGSPGPGNPDEVIPLAMIPVNGNSTYTFEPEVKVWVATGKYQAGELVDIADLKNAHEVDFSGKNTPKQKFTFGEGGIYTAVP